MPGALLLVHHTKRVGLEEGEDEDEDEDDSAIERITASAKHLVRLVQIVTIS